jgi:hypothetical protein
MNSSIHSVWCYGRKKKQVSKTIDRIISAHDSLSLLIIKFGGTCRNIQVQRGVVFWQTTLCNYIAQAPTPAIPLMMLGNHHLTHCEKRTAAGAGGKLAEQLL